MSELAHSAAPGIAIEGLCFRQASVCVPILRSLPAWFGIKAAILHYSAEIDHLPTWLACAAGRAVGFVSVKQHTSFSAEIYVMGILPEMHRQGIGRALIDHAQEWLTNQGIEYLQVKTLGPSQPDVNYARTRSFYEAMGFRPLEEIKQVWDDQNPCLITDHR